MSVDDRLIAELKERRAAALAAADLSEVAKVDDEIAVARGVKRARKAAAAVPETAVVPDGSTVERAVAVRRRG